jgi:uncharacterized protein YciI
MAWFLVEIRYVQEKLDEVRPRHRKFLSDLAEQGIAALGGPLGDGSGGISLYQAADEAALFEIIDQDPYYTEGVAAERTVREWKPVLGFMLPPEA